MKITPISGFPEWSPEGRLIEQHLLDRIRASFESFGFAPVETRAMEPLDHLLAKGETDKEIYVVSRLQADRDSSGDEDDAEARLGLHFDLTIPFARYVLEKQADLRFPFKRYQIQKVWRGERPQLGRYREFYQADIDVVGRDTLPLHFDGEMPWLLYEVLRSLPLPPVRVHVNNRKLIEGFYKGLGLEETAPILRVVDKLAKIGEGGVRRVLVEQTGLGAEQADACLALARICTSDASFADQVRALGVSHPLLDEGIAELTFVLDATKLLPQGAVWADLSLARGLDYYTGTVYEGFFADNREAGAICSGGRYDNLASGGNVRFPGVGVSIGLTRILGVLFPQGTLQASRATPTCALVMLASDEARGEANAVAHSLRQRGIPTEVFHEVRPYGKQLKYAAQRGIPYAWFPPAAAGSGQHEVRDVRSGQQAAADPAGWSPPEEDRRVQVRYTPK